MGLVAAIPAAIQIGGAIAGALSPKDLERAKATDAAFSLAVTGDENALLFLRQRTGEYGVVNVPGYGEVGGWATDPAKAYAKQKYQQALSQLNLMGQVSKVTAKAGDIVNDVANQAGYRIVPETWLWIAGAAAVVLLVVVFAKR